MSMQRLLAKMRKDMGRFALSLLAGVLIVWQLALPSVALAFQTHSERIPSPLIPQAQAALDRMKDPR